MATSHLVSEIVRLYTMETKNGGMIDFELVSPIKAGVSR